MNHSQTVRPFVVYPPAEPIRFRETRIIMGMPVTIDTSDPRAQSADIDAVFDYFTAVDARFSTYKDDSEVSRINRGEIAEEDYSDEMREVLRLAEETKRDTNGYFDISRADGTMDPSGVVKGWAIRNAAQVLSDLGYQHFYVDAGGDIQTRGNNAEGGEWSVGIRNPFNIEQIVKVVYPHGMGIATSGTYIRGQHIYNPYAREEALTDVVSLTVIGPDVFEADRYATAAFAMGTEGINFIERLPGFEAYEINAQGIARMTSGFPHYTRV